jgi:HAD superfamily hydrolase (TIGR01459 family)
MSRPSLFSAYASRFAFVFIDQFGVLHDGRRLYPGALDALRALKARGTRVVVLSNSGRSGAANAERMALLGLPQDLYDGFVTSGDVARDILTASAAPVARTTRARCLTIASSDAHELADSLGLISTDDSARADLLIVSGSQADHISLDEYERRIAGAARRGVPCVCTNPDKLMLSGGAVHPGAGAIAELYQKLGGAVTWIGKPYPEIYIAAARLVGAPSPSDVLCVGDSIEHDVVGARRFGALAALLRTGVLASLSEGELAEECARHRVTPDIVLRSLAD